jgi:hypothetical protein
MTDETERLIRQLWDLARPNLEQLNAPIELPPGEPSLAERDAALAAPVAPIDSIAHAAAEARNAVAYRLSMDSLFSYRESRTVSHVEVLGGADCCPTCSAYGPYRPIGADSIIPVPGCANDDGCICAFSPVLERPLGWV